MLIEHLKARLAAIEARGERRERHRAQTPTATRQTVRRPDGGKRELLMFCANDYLGLASHPALVQALADGAQHHGAGAGASPLVSGHSELHHRLEERLAAWYAPHIPGARVLGFSCGYMANIAVLSTLCDADTEIFSERLNHASLIDGARLSRARVTPYPHADLCTLRAQLMQSQALIKLIATDAVFSMDGDIAPLADILMLAERFDAWVVVDDAHGFGVLGARGRGTLERLGLTSPRLILMGTLGKAAGLAGAFVVAEPTVGEYLLQAARAHLFSTAAPPALVQAQLTSLDLIEGPEGSVRRERLALLQSRLHAGLARLCAQHPALGWHAPRTDTPVQPLIVGDNAAAMDLSERLARAGIRVAGIRPPSVPAGTARLRITLCAGHTRDDVDRLLQALQACAHGCSPPARPAGR